MKIINICFLLYATTSIANAQSSPNQQTVLPDTFQNVLDLAHMSFTMPKNAVPVPVVKNKQMHYEYAVTIKDQPIEVRYSLAPMGYSVAEAYIGGKGVTPRPIKPTDNDLMAKTIAFAVAINAAGGVRNTNAKINFFKPEAVKKEFGADWGGTMAFEIVNDSFGTHYKYCVMTILHKNDVASAYVFYLSDTKDNIRKLMAEFVATTNGFYALKFK